MPSSTPIVRQMNWISIIIQLIILSILCLVFYIIDKVNFIYYAFLSFVALFFILRYLIPKDHRRGVSLYKREKYNEAIPYFQKSYDFFSVHKWIDKYRIVTMLSSSKISYSEMARINKAFCLSQIGKKQESIEEYKKTLEEFPGSKIAEMSLKMLQ